MKDKLQDIFRDVFDDESLELSVSQSQEDFEEWDSLAHIQLLSRIQKEFKVKFSVHDIMNLKNVGDILELLNRTL